VDDQQQYRWRPTRRQLLWAGAAVGLLTIAILVGYRYGITLWDWIKLLVVPAVIAGGGLWFNRQQRERELEMAREQRERDVEIADRRAQDEALQAYLDQIGHLLLGKERPLRQSKEGDEVRTLARARTLTVLRRLDGERKGRVLQFLNESRLIAKDHTVINLSKADLSEVDLRGAHLFGADLREANLRGANLSGTSLLEAILEGANLSGANLSEAILSWAILNGANLTGADLSRARLLETSLEWAEGKGTNLIGTDLSGADLRRVHLRDANFSGALGVTNEELKQQAMYLGGATMPDGQKYEDWLKSKGGGEDGENSGP
jgi:uncharacterized protein YjbI with pentapeptide repeats